MKSPIIFYLGEGNGWSLIIDQRFWQTPREHVRYAFVWHYWPGDKYSPYVHEINMFNKTVFKVWKEWWER